MTPLEIPGVAEALQKERFLRDSAFLGLPETVAGFELRPLTLGDYILLRMIRSPLLTKETPAPWQLAQFLWMQSVEFSTSDRARRRFLKRCRSFYPPRQPLLHFQGAMRRWKARADKALALAASVLVAVRDYVEESEMDAPASKVNAAFNPEYYSSICFWVSLFDYAYTPEQVLSMPIKVLFQFLKQGGGSKVPIFNRLSGKVAADWLASKNAELGRN